MATGAGKSSPEPNHTETLPGYGVFRGTPFLRSIPFDSVLLRFYCATPTQHASPRCR